MRCGRGCKRFTWKGWVVKFMGIYPELDNLTLDALKAALYSPCPDGDEYAFGYYEEVALLIMAKGGAEYLRSQLDIAQAERLAAVIFGITSTPISDPVLTQRLISLLSAAHEIVVMAVIDGLRFQSETSAVDIVLGLNTHHSPYVRGAVLRYIRTLFPEQALPLLIASLADDHYIVREVAADELGELYNTAALPHLKKLLDDPHPHVRQAVETAIEWLEETE
jgi:hypothetical protein